MRSAPRDQSRILIATGYVADAASGYGVCNPGNVPFTFTRNSTGTYDIAISDARVCVLSGLSSPDDAGASPWTTGVHVNSPTSIRVMARTMTTAAPTNASFTFQLTALDRR